MRTRSSGARRLPAACEPGRPGDALVAATAGISLLIESSTSIGGYQPSAASARESTSALEQRAHRVYQRILLIVALHQHGIERCD